MLMILKVHVSVLANHIGRMTIGTSRANAVSPDTTIELTTFPVYYITVTPLHVTTIEDFGESTTNDGTITTFNASSHQPITLTPQYRTTNNRRVH